MQMKKTWIPEIHGHEGRKALAEAVIVLLDCWRLDEKDKLTLLGLSDSSVLAGYRQGAPLADDPDLLEQVGHLLAIDRALRKACPAAPEFYAQWIKIRNESLEHKSPMEVIRRQGIEGLRKVRCHIEKVGG